jgi:hypothetical protein
MKIFITEFKVGNEIYDGPPIKAKTFKEAEAEADLFDLIVVGVLDVIIVGEKNEYGERVLH